jgi:hypothetical protein
MTSEIRDGMGIEWDVAIEMDDGFVLCADVPRPVEDGQLQEPFTGVGPFWHDDARDRPSALLIPVI